MTSMKCKVPGDVEWCAGQGAGPARWATTNQYSTFLYLIATDILNSLDTIKVNLAPSVPALKLLLLKSKSLSALVRCSLELMIHVETNIISMLMIGALSQTIACLVSSLLMICVVNYATRSHTWDAWKLQQSIEEISQLKTLKKIMSKVRNMFSALFAQLAFFTCWWHTSSRIGPIWCNLIEGDRFGRREGCGRCHTPCHMPFDKHALFHIIGHLTSMCCVPLLIAKHTFFHNTCSFCMDCADQLSGWCDFVKNGKMMKESVWSRAVCVAVTT